MFKLDKLKIIVIGGLNTDIVALGAKKFLKAGEYTYANELKIGPGGKSRNIAQMIAALNGSVVMVGKTSQDPYGLWKFPLEALKKAGVNTDFVKIVSFNKSKQFPGVAVIIVDKSGKNQIYVLPGITNDLQIKDIDAADKLFKIIQKNNGALVLSLELPLKIAIYAVKKANKLGIKVFLDPGGINEEQDYSGLLKQGIFLLKPNEHEAKILTGIEVTNSINARQAAQKILKMGIKHVFITLGNKGGYLFSDSFEKHIPIPKINVSSAKNDETGCGDQVMAALSTALVEGWDIIHAAKEAILAGTLQFNKLGIMPITKKELDEHLN